MIWRWTWYLTALLGTLVFHLYYFGWASWYLLVVLLALPWLSLLVSLPGMLKMQVRWNWQISAHCTRGAQAALRLGHGDQWAPSMRRRMMLSVTHAGTGKSWYWDLWLKDLNVVTLDTSHCGVLQCHMERGWVYDVLGMFRLPCHLPLSRELVVLPVPTAIDPAPDLTPLRSVHWKPKSADPAERHELRDYRPGDPMRSVHWKLSTKTDKLMVREPQEPVRRTALVTLDLPANPDALDAVLDRFCWMQEWLLDNEIAFEVRYLEPRSGRMCRTEVQSAADAERLMERILHTPLAENAPSLALRSFPDVDWRYHIDAEGAAP